MKRKLQTTLAATLLLAAWAGCTNQNEVDDSLSPTSSLVPLRLQIGLDEATRAEESQLIDSLHNGFSFYAFYHDSKGVERVVYQGNVNFNDNDYWLENNNTPTYWPMEDTVHVTFRAISLPYVQGVTEMPDNYDVLVADVTSSLRENGSGVITLPFKHLMAKASMKFQYERNSWSNTGAIRQFIIGCDHSKNFDFHKMMWEDGGFLISFDQVFYEHLESGPYIPNIPVGNDDYPESTAYGFTMASPIYCETFTNAASSEYSGQADYYYPPGTYAVEIEYRPHWIEYYYPTSTSDSYSLESIYGEFTIGSGQSRILSFTLPNRWNLSQPIY